MQLNRSWGGAVIQGRPVEERPSIPVRKGLNGAKVRELGGNVRPLRHFDPASITTHHRYSLPNGHRYRWDIHSSPSGATDG